MRKKKDKLSVISEIYSQFTEENKEKLMKAAKTLLKIQNVVVSHKIFSQERSKENGKKEFLQYYL